MSSISGSDSDSEDEEEEDGDWPRRDVTVPGADDDDEDSWAQSGRKSTQLAFQNSDGQYLVVQRCILMGKVRATTRDPWCTENRCVSCADLKLVL
jgi:hypothetical protein